MVLQEFRQSVRALSRVPSLAAISVLTIALGVGGGTSLFSVVKAVLLNPLPFKESGRIAWIAEVNRLGRQSQVAYQNYLDWQSQSTSFQAMAALAGGPTVLSGGDVPQSTRGTAVTQDFFSVMGAETVLGRTFSAEEHKDGAPVVILSNAMWKNAFGGRPDVIGRSIRVLGIAPTVIGVMQPGFDYPQNTGLWLPAEMLGDPGLGVRTGHNWRVVAKLKASAGIERAQSEVDAIERRIKEQFPSPFQGVDAVVMTLQAHEVGQVRQGLLMLFGAGGFLLLIVCVNVANLLLVRATARARELSVRTALGARRWQLVRQMLAESLILALGGGVGGLLLAAWSMDLIRVLLPADVPGAAEIRIDGGVILFAIAVSTLAGLLFGSLPAWRASMLNIGESLKAGSRSISAGRRSHRMQAALVISEVCLSLVLVAGAGLLGRSFLNLTHVDAGFQPNHVLKVDTQFQAEAGVSLTPKYRDILARARSIPGVEAAGMARNIPIDSPGPDGHFFIESRRGEVPGADAVFDVISPGYFTAMRIPLLRGRDFSDEDTEVSQPVAIVSAEMARAYFADGDPIGQRIWFDPFEPQEHWATIVGVVGDVREGGVAQRIMPAAYANFAQLSNGKLLNGGTLVVRTGPDPAAISSALRSAVIKANADAAPAPKTMNAVMSASLAKQRFQIQILGGFAVLALLLAAVGLYGVLSHLVTANRLEIGIRMALGASRAILFRGIAGRALGLAALGVAAGLAGCYAMGRVMASMLFGVGVGDPVTLGAASLVLLVAAFVAASFPARRATRVDPMVVLRDE